MKKIILLLVLIVFILLPLNSESSLIHSSYLATLFYNQYKEYHQNYFSGDDINRLVSKIFRPKVLNFYCQVTCNGNGQIANSIISYALQYNLPIHFCMALCYTESEFNPMAKGYNFGGSYDRGLYQLNNLSFRFKNEKDVYDINLNVQTGLGCLKWCYDNTNQSKEFSLIAYNMGYQGYLNYHGVIPEFRKGYVNKVLAYEKYLDEEFNKYEWK